MSDFELNKKKRKASRARCTKLCESIKEEWENEQVNWTSLTAKLDLLKVREEELNCLNKEIEKSAEESFFDECYEEELEGIEKYALAIRETQLMAEKKRGELNNIVNSLGTLNLGSAVKSTNMVKLPQLDLPKFSGDPLQFTSFMEAFESTIDNNTDIPVISKFNYLRAYLQDEAFNVIKPLPVEVSNYPIAITRLKERYGKPIVITHAHVNQILDLEPVVNMSSAQPLRKLAEDLEFHTKALNKLGVDASRYDLVLFPIVSRLLPNELIINFYSKAKPLAISDLIEEVKAEVENRSLLELFNNKEDKSNRKGNKESKSEYVFNNSKGYRTASALHVGEQSEVQRERNKHCVLCFSKDHWIEECTTVKPYEEKIYILKTRGRCFRCASRDHMARDCRNERARCSQCGGRHLDVLCSQFSGNSDEHKETPLTVHHVELQQDQTEILIQTGRVFVGNKEGVRVDVRFLMDGGSQATFITEELFQKLNLAVVQMKTVKINTFGGISTVKRCKEVVVPLYNRDNKSIGGLKALVIEKLSVQKLPKPSEEIICKCFNRRMTLADLNIDHGTNNQEIELLIGGDQYWSFVYNQIMFLQDRLVAVNTKMGWVLQGPQRAVFNPRQDEVEAMFLGCEEDNQQIENIWKLDAIGVQSVADKNQINQQVDVQWTGKRYAVSLPWIEGRKEELQDNKEAALKRLHYLLKNLSLFPERLLKYHETILGYVENDYAEIVPEKDKLKPSYFMPHRCVIREGTTTDLRVVNDASARVRDCFSLNECLEAGYDRGLDVVGMLLRFRMCKFVVVADIEKAFLQIEIKEEDSNYLKFWWLNCNKKLEKPFEVIEYRMKRVTFGVNSSPFLLQFVIKHHLEKYKEDFGNFIEQLLKNLYVDDLIMSDKKESALLEKCVKAYYVFEEGNFKLRKWACNSKEVLKRLQEKGLNVQTTETVKVLGQQWKLNEDKFTVVIPIKIIKDSVKVTKREMLSVMSAIFDPLGVMSAITVKAKVLIQKVWLGKHDWDEELDNSISKAWMKWKTEVLNLNEFFVNRWCYYREGEEVELHVFNDASVEVYGAVVMMRVTSENGSVKVSFLIAKYRVAPLKKLEIPSLELMSALIGVRLRQYCIQEMGLDQVQCYHWTDSLIVLNWIQNVNKVREVFVQNRLKEIRQGSAVNEWRHCPGNINPADFGTRTSVVIDREKLKSWLAGPEWLVNTDNWPRIAWVAERECNVNLIGAVEKGEEFKLYEIVNVKRYSNWKMVVNIVCYMLRFIENCKTKREGRVVGPITHEEMVSAERVLIINDQWTSFSKDITHIKQNKTVGKHSNLKDFKLFLDKEGIVRLSSRLDSAIYNYNTRNPIILDGRSQLVKLLLMRIHERMLHCGVGTLLTETRNNYWIIRGRSTCKTVIRDCLVCKRRRGKVFNPISGLLPEERIVHEVAFGNVGIDFAGPLMVKVSDTTPTKTYIMLVTCLTSRAVHLELMSSLSTEIFVLAFQRFMARRGLPSVIYSDNGLTFKKMDKIFKQVLVTGSTLPQLSFFKVENLAWKFIPERAPWMGGCWERLVRSVKDILRKVLGNAFLNFEELSTLLVVVESVVNSRPLDYLSLDDEVYLPITPNHLICGRALTAFPVINDLKCTHLNVMSRYMYVKGLLRCFCNRWMASYLLQLRSANYYKGNTKGELSVGDVVIVKQDGFKKNLFTLGKILSLNVGRDGVVRSARLMSDNREICRPVKLLCPFVEKSTDLNGGGVLNVEGANNNVAAIAH